MKYLSNNNQLGIILILSLIFSLCHGEGIMVENTVENGITSVDCTADNIDFDICTFVAFCEGNDSGCNSGVEINCMDDNACNVYCFQGGCQGVTINCPNAITMTNVNDGEFIECHVEGQGEAPLMGSHIKGNSVPILDIMCSMSGDGDASTDCMKNTIITADNVTEVVAIECFGNHCISGSSISAIHANEFILACIGDTQCGINSHVNIQHVHNIEIVGIGSECFMNAIFNGDDAGLFGLSCEHEHCFGNGIIHATNVDSISIIGNGEDVFYTATINANNASQFELQCGESRCAKEITINIDYVSSAIINCTNGDNNIQCMERAVINANNAVSLDLLCFGDACLYYSKVNINSAISSQIGCMGNICMRWGNIMASNAGELSMMCINPLDDEGQGCFDDQTINVENAALLNLNCQSPECLWATQIIADNIEQVLIQCDGGDCLHDFKINANNGKNLGIFLNGDEALTHSEIICPQNNKCDASDVECIPCYFIFIGEVNEILGTDNNLYICTINDLRFDFDVDDITTINPSVINDAINIYCESDGNIIKWENPEFVTDSPTSLPTGAPTGYPTRSPTKSPTDSPTDKPTGSPSSSPTDSMTTNEPTSSPTDKPTDKPIEIVTSTPITSTLSPSASPISKGNNLSNIINISLISGILFFVIMN